jgi:hypothetical protein
VCINMMWTLLSDVVLHVASGSVIEKFKSFYSVSIICAPSIILSLLQQDQHEVLLRSEPCSGEGHDY